MWMVGALCTQLLEVVAAASDRGPLGRSRHEDSRAEGGCEPAGGGRDSCGTGACSSPHPTPGGSVMSEAWALLTKVKHHLLFRANGGLENK